MATAFPDAPAWPEAKPAAAHIGHNKPPIEDLIPAEFRAALLADRADFLEKVDALVGAAGRAQAVDDETLGRCGDLVKAYRAAIKHTEATHQAVKQPYLDGGRLVDAERKSLLAPIEDAKRKVESIANAFVAKRDAEARAERDRIAAEQRKAAEAAEASERAREQAERAAEQAALTAKTDEERAAANALAAETARQAEQSQAAAALAPAMPDRPEPVRSDAGATVSGKQEWKSEVTDFTLAFMAVEDHPNVRDAITKAIAQQVRAGKRSIEGVRIWPVAKANFS